MLVADSGHHQHTKPSATYSIDIKQRKCSTSSNSIHSISSSSSVHHQLIATAATCVQKQKSVVSFTNKLPPISSFFCKNFTSPNQSLPQSTKTSLPSTSTVISCIKKDINLNVSKSTLNQSFKEITRADKIYEPQKSIREENQRLPRSLQLSSSTTVKQPVNELIKRLANKQASTSANIPPTNTHRIPNDRDSCSNDSLNLEMCYFKPIKPVPITPYKKSISILKRPIPRRIKLTRRKCEFFIGPKRTQMPVLFSSSTAFVKYTGIFSNEEDFTTFSECPELQSPEKILVSTDESSTTFSECASQIERKKQNIENIQKQLSNIKSRFSIRKCHVSLNRIKKLELTLAKKNLKKKCKRRRRLFSVKKRIRKPVSKMEDSENSENVTPDIAQQFLKLNSYIEKFDEMKSRINKKGTVEIRPLNDNPNVSEEKMKYQKTNSNESDNSGEDSPIPIRITRSKSSLEMIPKVDYGFDTTNTVNTPKNNDIKVMTLPIKTKAAVKEMFTDSKLSFEINKNSKKNDINKRKIEQIADTLSGEIIPEKLQKVTTEEKNEIFHGKIKLIPIKDNEDHELVRADFEFALRLQMEFNKMEDLPREPVANRTRSLKSRMNLALDDSDTSLPNIGNFPVKQDTFDHDMTENNKSQKDLFEISNNKNLKKEKKSKNANSKKNKTEPKPKTSPSKRKKTSNKKKCQKLKKVSSKKNKSAKFKKGIGDSKTVESNREAENISMPSKRISLRNRNRAIL